VLDGGEVAELLLEADEEGGVEVEHRLEGDGLPGALVAGGVDDAHSAAPSSRRIR